MRIAGLDVATTTGWAVSHGNSFRAGKWRPEGKSEGMIAFEFLTWCRQFLIVERVDFVGIEAPLLQVGRDVIEQADGEMFGARKVKKAETSPKTLGRLWTLNNLAQAACESLNVPWAHVAVSTHRKAFLGAGRIPAGEGKDRTLAQCRQLGINITSKDAADAVSVAWWAAAHCRQERLRPGDLFARAG